MISNFDKKSKDNDEQKRDAHHAFGKSKTAHIVGKINCVNNEVLGIRISTVIPI